MHRSIKAPWAMVAGASQQVRRVARQSERTLLVGTILLGLWASAAVGFVLSQYYAVDVLDSLISAPQDCWLNWPSHVGRHCFADYQVTVDVAMRPNPWQPYWVPRAGPAYQPLRIEYPAAGMVPHLLLGSLAKWFAFPQLGLLIALPTLTIALIAPAIWAARGARGLERIVVFVACGAAAVPAWKAIDRGNLVGLMAPIALVFLVALSRRRWVLVAITVVLAALVKPQFAILAVALFAARQWRLGGAAIVSVLLTNVAAYLLWPRDFPGTIGQSIANAFGYTGWGPVANWWNVSFANALFFSARKAIRVLTGQVISDGFVNFAMSLIAYSILIVAVVSIFALGRRIDPVMAGIALLATVSLSPPLGYSYYLVFALPIAALVVRDPGGPPGWGLFDRLEALGDRRRAVGICVSLAAAFSIAQIALPGPRIQLSPPLGGTHALTLVPTTAYVVPLAWLVASAVIMASYARRPAYRHVTKSEDSAEEWTPDGDTAPTGPIGAESPNR